MKLAGQFLRSLLFAAIALAVGGMMPLVSAAEEPSSSGPVGIAEESRGLQGEQPGGMRGEGGGAMDPRCRAEVKQLCGGVEPGGGRIKQCLKENEGKLSAGCREQLQQKAGRMKEHMKGRRHELREACAADVKRMCSSVERGEGRIVNCLREHKSELSEGCALSLGKGRRK